ncbi:MAG: response regulator transcription factor [Myxococcota bacterium]
MSATVLLVEDEADIASVLQFNLEREQMQVRVAHHGAHGLELAQQSPPPSLVVLDVMLPDMSGLEVCRRLRAHPGTATVPIMLLTALGEEIDRVVGFEMGADDYVVKPFSVRELVLRIKALLRRAQPEQEAQVRSYGMLRVDVDGHRAWVGNEEVPVTALEFKLLMTFVGRAGRTQTREALLDEVWGSRGDVGTRTVDTSIKRLREKLGPAGDYVETVRGVGYRWATPRPMPQ